MNEISTLSAISLKLHPYAGYARALYYAITGEMLILDIELPAIREVEERSNESSKVNIDIYPNPATNTVSLSDSLSKCEDVEIYNTQGNLIIKTKVSPIIDVSSLQDGLYFLRFSSEYMESTISKVLIAH